MLSFSGPATSRLSLTAVITAVGCAVAGPSILGAQDVAGPLSSSGAVAVATAVTLVESGIVSASHSESGATVSPDGKELYYVVTDRAFTRMTIVRSQRARVGDPWGRPEIAAFSGQWNDGSPSISPDGRRLLFISNRPPAGATTANPTLDLWYMDRDAGGAWSEPRHATSSVNSGQSISYPSLAADGTLYFGRGRGVYRAGRGSGDYENAQAMAFGSDTAAYSTPAVAPDQNFIILAGPGATPTDTDLYISVNCFGKWARPQRIAAPVNSPNAESSPSISPDGQTLYFASERVDRTTIAWPRPQRLGSYAALDAELNATVQNGLRNIYSADLSRLTRTCTQE